jgi:hypothetical protein
MITRIQANGRTHLLGFKQRTVAESLSSLHKLPRNIPWRGQQWLQNKQYCHGETNLVQKLFDCTMHNHVHPPPSCNKWITGVKLPPTNPGFGTGLVCFPIWSLFPLIHFYNPYLLGLNVHDTSSWFYSSRRCLATYISGMQQFTK